VTSSLLSDLIARWRAGTPPPQPQPPQTGQKLRSGKMTCVPMTSFLYYVAVANSSTSAHGPGCNPTSAGITSRLHACTKLIGGRCLELHLRRHVSLKSGQIRLSRLPLRLRA
jgi:hypothetical protein